MAPNIFAYLVLFSWPLVGTALFALFPARVACLLTIFGAELFLPANFSVDPPLLPPLGKDLIASASALIGCVLMKPGALWKGPSRGRKYELFLLLLVIGEFFTNLTNRDPISYGPTTLPGVTLHDFFATSTRAILNLGIPFYLGRRLFSRPADLQLLLKAYVVGAVVYILPILIELRLSPQLNMWVYGYHQSDFTQTIRGSGGYRPKVFMRHGLNVGLFLALATMAAVGLRRIKARVLGLNVGVLAAILAVILVLCKSTGALFYAAAAVPFLLWCRARGQSRLGVGMALFVFVFPLLRFNDLIPVQNIADFFAATAGPERAASLQFRFDNENALLEHAARRLWFGWGGYSRSFVFSSWGKRESVVDGVWVGQLGSAGIVGFVGLFGLLLAPLIGLGRRLATFDRNGRFLCSTALIMMSFFALDLVPNSGLGPYLTLTIGALAGVTPDPPSGSVDTAPVVA